MAPGDISSDKPVLAPAPPGKDQNWPPKRGKNRKQATASGMASASARAASRSAERTGNPVAGWATIIMAAQATHTSSR